MTELLLPPGPLAPYDNAENLLGWMETNGAKYGDIFQASVYGSTVYVVSSPDYVRHILRRNWQNYQKGLSIRRVTLLLGRGLISSEGEFWKSQRRLIQPAFHRNVIAGLKPVIVQANAKLLAKWEAAAGNNATVNVTRDIGVMILELVLISIFGEDYAAAAPRFSPLAEGAARDLQFAQTFSRLRQTITEIAQRRRATQRAQTDFLGMLMQARDRDTGEAMSDDQLAKEIMTLIVAGHETTALTLNWAWYLLAKNPDAEAALAAAIAPAGGAPPDYAELTNFPYPGQIIDETLRLYPPVWLLTRKARNDDQLGPYFVPAKTEIYFSPYNIQRNPALWNEPARFDPSRFDPERADGRAPLATLPFSAGPRNCIGEELARFEMQIHLMMIAGKLRLRYDDERQPDLELGVNLSNRFDFIMRPEIRKQPLF